MVWSYSRGSARAVVLNSIFFSKCTPHPVWYTMSLDFMVFSSSVHTCLVLLLSRFSTGNFQLSPPSPLYLCIEAYTVRPKFSFPCFRTHYEPIIDRGGVNYRFGQGRLLPLSLSSPTINGISYIFYTICNLTRWRYLQVVIIPSELIRHSPVWSPPILYKYQCVLVSVGYFI